METNENVTPGNIVKTIPHLHLTASFCLLMGIAICLALPNDLRAATYYLDAVNGNDSNTGTSGAPWKSIAKAKSTVGGGDIVNLLPGNYGAVTFGEAGDSYGTTDAYITYLSYPAPYGAKFTSIRFDNNGLRDYYIIISGLDVNSTGVFASIGMYGAKNVKILNCKAYGPPGGIGPTAGIFMRNLSKNILVEDCEVYHSRYGIMAWNSFNVTILNLV